MATLLDITNYTWQLSANAFGQVVQGLASIRQRIDIVLRTTKGSDPLRAEFGTDIYTYVDESVLIAVPAIKAEIITALALWMPEITIITITDKVSGGHIKFFITYGLVDSDIVDTISYSLADGAFISSAARKLVLQGSVPLNPNNYQYFVQLTLNGVIKPPFAPENGFASVIELYSYIQASYSYLADWYLKGNSITGYIKDQQFTTGSIEVSLKQQYKIVGIIPNVVAGETIVLVFEETPTGAVAPQPTSGFASKGELLAWVQTNLSAYGTWAIEQVPGDFNNDFNNDFATNFNVLVLYTTIYNQATITLTVS